MKLSLKIVAALILTTQISACVPVVVGGAAAGGAMAADRRTSGIYVEDENIELKANKLIYEALTGESHVNITSFKGNVLITGEVPNEATKAAVEQEARKIIGVREIYNELGIGPVSPLSSRSNDSFIDSKVKARLVDTNQVSANHIKVVTERGIVYLMGIVSEREAKVAVAVARTTDGVRKVVNVLEVVSEDETRRIDNQTLGARNPPPQSAPVEKR